MYNILYCLLQISGLSEDFQSEVCGVVIWHVACRSHQQAWYVLGSESDLL